MVMRHKSRIGFFVGAWVGMSVMPFTYPVDNLPQVEIVFAPPWVSVGEVFQVVVQGTPAADGRELLYEWGAKLGDQTEVEVFQAGSMAKIVAPELPSRVLEDVITVEVIVLENSLASAPAMVGIPLYHARLAFPQVGVGSIDEHQRLETSIVLVNSLDEYAFGTFRFTAGQEDPGEWEVLVDGVPASKFEFMMEPFSSREFLVTGDDVRAGWLDLTANISLAGHLFYRVRSTTGVEDESVLLEVPILPAKGRSFMAALSPGENANIALALVNLSEEPVYFQVAANQRSEPIYFEEISNRQGGASLRTDDIKLEPHGHMARFLQEIFRDHALSTLSPAFNGGTLVVETTGGDRALLGVTILKTTQEGLPFSMLPLAIIE